MQSVHKMRLIAASVVCVSVSLGYVREPCKNG